MTKNFVQQAPQMTQMIAPDIAAQQVALQRQQQLADLLMQQGTAAPDKTEMVSGVAVKQSPLIGLSKMLQAYMGGKMQADNDAKGLELGKLLQGRMGDILGGSSAPNYSLDPNGTGGAMPKQLGSGMADTGDAPQGTGAPILPSGGLPLVPPAGAVPQAPPNNFTMANLLKGQTIEALGGNSAAGAYWDQYKTPEAVKTMDLTGQDRQQMGRYASAAARKGGMLEMQPGNTVLDLLTNAKTVAPDFKLGIAGGYGANGQPTMGRINGSGALSELAGEAKEAEAKANARYKLMQIEMPNGKVEMVTEEQAAQMARQNQQNMPTAAPRNQSGAIPPPSQPSSNSTVPSFPSANNNWPQLPSGAPSVPSQGIAVISPADKAAALERAKLGVNKEFDQPKEQFSFTSAIGSIDNALKQVDYLSKHPGLSHITGTIAGRTPNISNYATNAQADLDTLKSQISSQVITEMRNASKTGGAVGNVTENEWPRLENQLGALQQAQSTKQFRERLKDVRETLGRVRAAYSTEYNAKHKQPNAQNTQTQPAANGWGIKRLP